MDLQRVVKSGQDQVQVRDWLKKLRAAEQAPKPVEIKIVKADQIGKVDRFLTIKRDSDGKMRSPLYSRVSITLP